MAPSEAQKRASNKYNLEHMSTLGCKVRKAQAVAFKAYCQNQGNTSNTVLKDFVLGCIGEQETVPQAGESAPGVPLSPEALKTAQEAAESTGETVPPVCWGGRYRRRRNGTRHLCRWVSTRPQEGK